MVEHICILGSRALSSSGYRQVFFKIHSKTFWNTIGSNAFHQQFQSRSFPFTNTEKVLKIVSFETLNRRTRRKERLDANFISRNCSRSRFVFSREFPEDRLTDRLVRPDLPPFPSTRDRRGLPRTSPDRPRSRRRPPRGWSFGKKTEPAEKIGFPVRRTDHRRREVRRRPRPPPAC